MLTTAQAIAEFLRGAGTTHFFQVTGGDQGLWFALRDAGIRMVSCRTEQGAAYMADGFARATRGPAWVYGQHGPGASNISSSLADAYWAQSAVIALTSSIPIRERDQFAYQEIRHGDVFAPFTSWTGEATHPDDVARVLRLALRAAMTTRSPAHVDIPRDIFDEPAVESVADVEPWLRALPALAPADASPGAIAEAAGVIASANRVAVLAGPEALLYDAYTELAEFCRVVSGAVVVSMSGKGAVAESFETFCGVAGRYGSPVANQALSEADVVVAVGSALDKLSTDNHRLLRPGAPVVQLTADAAALGCAYSPVVPVYGGVPASLAALTKALPGEADWRGERSVWAARLADDNRVWRKNVSDAFANAHPIHPVAVVDAISASLTERDVVVADTGYMAAWAGVLLPLPAEGPHFLRAAGSLGWALPGAIGAAFGRPDSRVVAVTGDGGFAYNAFEIETAVRYGLSLVVVVLNNVSLAFEYHLQRRQFGEHISETTDFSDVDIASLARSLGAQAVRVDSAADVRPAVLSALEGGGVWVVDVRIDKDAIPPVTSYGLPADGLLPRV